MFGKMECGSSGVVMVSLLLIFNYQHVSYRGVTILKRVKVCSSISFVSEIVQSNYF